jgi:hypothetical protein
MYKVRVLLGCHMFDRIELCELQNEYCDVSELRALWGLSELVYFWYWQHHKASSFTDTADHLLLSFHRLPYPLAIVYKPIHYLLSI